MPLLEIKQVRHICASVWLDQDTVAQVDRYPAFIRASADDVVDKALIRYGGEGVIGFHISWQCKNGALHRKNGGHVTPIWELRSARQRRSVYERELVLAEYFASRRSFGAPLAFTSVNGRAPLSAPGVNMLTRKRFSHCGNTATGGPFAMNRK
jgi:hypothetical protein